MDRELIIFVDMDDTIEDLRSSWLQYLNEKHGTNVKEEDITHWNITKFFPTVAEKDIFSPLEERDFWKKVVPKPGAQEYLYKLKSEGHQLYIVTSGSYKTIRPKIEETLMHYFPFFDPNDVILMRDKTLLRGDVMIDDNPYNLIGGSYCRLLMDAPHNKHINEKYNRLTRVYNWKDAYNEIEKISQRDASVFAQNYYYKKG